MRLPSSAQMQELSVPEPAKRVRQNNHGPPLNPVSMAQTDPAKQNDVR